MNKVHRTCNVRINKYLDTTFLFTFILQKNSGFYIKIFKDLKLQQNENSTDNVLRLKAIETKSQTVLAGSTKDLVGALAT